MIEGRVLLKGSTSINMKDAARYALLSLGLSFSTKASKALPRKAESIKNPYTFQKILAFP
jgi:hypothetical protein